MLCVVLIGVSCWCVCFFVEHDVGCLIDVVRFVSLVACCVLFVVVV